MILRQNYKCNVCGKVFPVEEVLLPPKDGDPGKVIPCKECESLDWKPIK